MIQCLLNQLSKQTDFIQQQHKELQREVLIDRNNIQYKNIHQFDTKETNIVNLLNKWHLLMTKFYNLNPSLKKLKQIIRPADH